MAAGCLKSVQAGIFCWSISLTGGNIVVMSSKLNWAINIVLLVLIILVLFSPRSSFVLDVGFILSTAAYFVVQMARYHGGDETRRFQWTQGPRWWRRFASDDFEKRGKKKTDPPSSAPRQ